MLDQLSEEFSLEAQDLFDESEESLLCIDNGEEFEPHFNSIFRCFHSLKGAAGMFELNDLQNHMHKIEDQFEKEKEIGKISKEKIDYYLNAIDYAKEILNNTATKEFNYNFRNDKNIEEKTSKDVPTLDAKKVDIINKKKSIGSIVIVDDEEVICELLSDILEDYGYTTRSFTEASKAIEEIKKIKPDLIFIDLKMPTMDSTEMVKCLEAEKMDIPVCVISDCLTKDRILELYELGVKGFINKPFDSSQLISLVNSIIEQKKTMRLLNQSIHFILYQFQDIDNYLKKNGKNNIRNSFKAELENIMILRDKLK
ncbi:response regulator [Bacteriovoracaceae bacterium]|nr:response regulator [Bacteriovoracaceae bacterium]